MRTVTNSVLAYFHSRSGVAVVAGFALVCGLALAPASAARAQVDARMFRFPDVSETHIAFVYAGDIWIVEKGGGTAHRLSSPAGEESFPRFSPDGTRIAFSGNYDGNTDVYVVAATGGPLTRVTHHPGTDRLVDWRPSGGEVFFASTRESGRTRFNQLYSVSAEGGMPTKLPVTYGEFAAFSPDETTLAFMPKSRDFRTWKRYRGGWQSDIWLFDLETYESTNITANDAVDGQPMWFGDAIYFLSDRGPNQRHNIWAYDRTSGDLRQVTSFEEVDISFPAIGGNDIVFQAGGRLYRVELPSEQMVEVEVDIVTDLATLAPRAENVGDLIQTGDISPTGVRAVFSARGDIFTVPAEHGLIRNLTNSSGSSELYPTWSPDARHIAYWGDATNEWNLYLDPADGSGEARKITDLGPGLRYTPWWSPDSEKIAFIDSTLTIRIVDTETGEITSVGRAVSLLHPQLAGFQINWSADSSWIAYSRMLETSQTAIFLYDVRQGALHQVTSAYYNNFAPAFDPDGKYLYFLSKRTLSPVYSSIDRTWIYPNSTNLLAVPLRADVESPLAPENDEEEVADEEESASGNDQAGDDDSDEGSADGEAGGQDDEDGDAEEETLKIDLDGFERRAIVLPVDAGNYADLQAVSGKVLLHRVPRSGSDDLGAPIVAYDLEEGEEMTIVPDANGFSLSANGKKLMVMSRGRFGIVNVAPGQKMDKPLRTGEMEMVVDPSSEWREVFTTVWRDYRDLFYDPNMHGLDWDGLGEHYGALVEDAVTRWDVNFVIGELIGELSASHTYVGGGDLESPDRRGVGLLGADFSLENGAYRIARIIDGAPWDNEVRSPLNGAGVDVNEGDYILAVNGIDIDAGKDPWAAFDGTAGEVVTLTVNDRPTKGGAREVLVETLRSEIRLRNLAWVEANRARVDELSGGRVGYVYVPDTGGNGQTELVRQYYAQIDKDAFIIDERFNSGGQLADRFIELLIRPTVHYIHFRDGGIENRQPFMASDRPKVMLINGWSVSGGDGFPYAFKSEGVGPIIGVRTTGGLIGPAVGHETIDGGFYTVPEGRIFGKDGTWFPEGIGIAPDIEVVEDHEGLARGNDNQLERAVQEAIRLADENPAVPVKRPDYEIRVPRQ